MCMMLYIGSDNELPVIKWQEGIGPLVCVGEVPECYAGVKKHFASKHQYIVGAGFMGCACALHFDDADEIDDVSTMNEIGMQALSDLFDYIKKNVSADTCELVSFWTSDEEKDLEYKDIININEFDWKSKFSFLKGQHVTVYK